MDEFDDLSFLDNLENLLPTNEDDAEIQSILTGDYIPQSVMEMSRRLTELFRSENFSAHEVTEKEAEAILKESRYGSVSIPLLTNQYTLQLKEAEK